MCWQTTVRSWVPCVEQVIFPVVAVILLDSMPLEELDFLLVLHCRRPGPECPQVAPLPGSGILLPGVEPVFAGGEFADHSG